METLAWGILVVATLACGSSCARPDWIEQTLVTVDVTGTWQGSVGGIGALSVGWYELTLEQQGAQVKGSVRMYGVAQTIAGTTISGPIEGTVAGDVFSFRQPNGPLTGETTVGGDEMSGVLSVQGARPITLRRVDSPSRPKAP
jgi:hypothetical protein